MLKLTICQASFSNELNNLLCEFVSSNMVDIFNFELDLAEDTDKDMKLIFPEAYVDSHSRADCCKVLRTLRDRLQSFVLYVNLTPLQQYVLDNVIEEWIELNEDEPELFDGIYFVVPEELQNLIRIESDEDGAAYIISCLQDMHEYEELFLEDTDFDEESIRGFVEATIHNTDRFLKEMSLEDLDQYIEVLPVDVAEEYKQFRRQKEEKNQLLECLITIGERLCSNATYSFKNSEDSINDYFRDMLKASGYHETHDQTRHGVSATHVSAGEVDLLVCQNEKEIGIIEGLKLDCLNRDYIRSHIVKVIDNYNALGTTAYVMTYVGTSDFETFWIKYCNYLKSYTFPISVKYEIEELPPPSAVMRICLVVLNKDGYEMPVYFIGIKMRI